MTLFFPVREICQLGEVKVGSYCERKRSAFSPYVREVYVDPATGMPYDILMSKVDVKYGMFGLNNFYKMQVRAVL